MLRLVGVEDGIKVVRAQLPAQIVDLRGVPGQEIPPVELPEARGILLQRCWPVYRRVQRDREQKQIAADPVSQQLVHARKIRGGWAAAFLAARIDEIHEDRFAFDQVVVEADRPALLCQQEDVGENVRRFPSNAAHLPQAPFEGGRHETRARLLSPTGRLGQCAGAGEPEACAGYNDLDSPQPAHRPRAHN